MAPSRTWPEGRIPRAGLIPLALPLVLALALGCGQGSVEVRIDSDTDGETDTLQRFEFDGGLRVLDAFDNGADGVIDGAVERTFDDEGRVLQATSLQSGTVISTHTFAYGAGGLPERRIWDDDGDGAPDYVYSYAYNEDGALVEERMADAEGALWQVTTLTQGPHGPTRLERDRSADGTVDQIYTYAYGEGGALSEMNFDFDGDGASDKRYAYLYEAGRMVQRAETTDPPGTPERVTEIAWDDDRRLGERAYDSEGALKGSVAYSYRRGRLRQAESDRDGDGIVDTLTTYEGPGALILTVLPELAPEASPPGPFDGIF